MHAHRNGGPPSGLPDPDSLDYLAQRIVLAELLIDAPSEGDSIDYLIDRLPLPPGAVEPALGALEVVGLAPRRGEVARATVPARYFEYLWPVTFERPDRHRPRPAARTPPGVAFGGGGYPG
jgi:hypothetical protein